MLYKGTTGRSGATAARAVGGAGVAVAAVGALLLAAAPAAVAAQGPGAAEGPALVQSARSTAVSLYNGTTSTIYRNYSDLSHGVWDDATPPENIEANKTGSWGSHSSGFMTGTEGEVRYQVAGGQVVIHWNNPFSGSNGYSCSAPRGYTCSWTGGSGNNASVAFSLSGSPAVAAARADLAPPVTAAAARSTHVILQNRTVSKLDRTSSSLKHGTWTENMLPPDAVFPMSNGAWQSESNGFMTGTEGKAVFNADGETTVEISWNNPYSGSNSYGCKVNTDKGYRCYWNGGSGDNAYVTFTVEKVS
ncbi:aegerolysin family protein [Kitasatospora sp. NPDC101183]|uniref:aegerolysin family protein n=1 Tax=Kitasatospora sp. NPDC101183 TaxID=3364100 RepID=UPI0038132F88